MDKLYEKVREKSQEIERRTYDFENGVKKHREENHDDDDDESRERRRRQQQRVASKSARSTTGGKSTTNRSNNSTRSLLSEFLREEFDDTRFKGKQLNCGRVSTKEKKEDILEKTEFGKKMKKNLSTFSKEHEKRLLEKELLEKSLKEREKTLAKFVCGKYKDLQPFPKNDPKKTIKRSKSASELYAASLASFQEKKETLKPFICGKVNKKEKIEYFSPLKTINDPKELLASARSGSAASARISTSVLLNSLNESKPISDKPLKFGKFKHDTDKNLFADSAKNKKANEKTKLTRKEIDELIRQEEKKKLEQRMAPMKFGKKAESKPIPYFSSEQRKTMSTHFNELNRSARGNSANASLLGQSRKQ